MRIVHFADLHLGIENYGGVNPRTGLSTRVDDFLRALDQIIDYALSLPADAILFAGDAFKNRDPNPTIQREFARRVRRLSTAGVPTVLLIGNHDLPSVTARATAMDIYETLEIPNIHVCRQPGLVVLETPAGRLQVVCLPWIARNVFLQDPAMRGLDVDEFQRRMTEIIAGEIGLLADRLDPELPSILLAHVSVEGARLGSEQSIMLGQELVLGRDDLHADRFDFVALGHIHQHQVIGSNPPIVYSGSPERVDFGEEREAKGFVVVEFVPSAEGRPEAEWRFEPLPARRFLTLRIDATHEDPMEDVQRVIRARARDIKGAIVRAAIALPPEREDQLRLEDVRRLLLEAGAFWVARVVREVDLQNRPRVDIRDDEALDPETMLRRWFQMRELSDPVRQRVIDAGLALIRSERERS